MLGKADGSVEKGFITPSLSASIAIIGTGAVSTVETVINKNLGRTNVAAAGILAYDDAVNISANYRVSGFISNKDALSLAGNVLAAAAGVALIMNPVGGAVVTGLALASVGATVASMLMDKDSQLVNSEQIAKVKSSLNEVFSGNWIENFFLIIRFI